MSWPSVLVSALIHSHRRGRFGGSSIKSAVFMCRLHGRVFPVSPFT